MSVASDFFSSGGSVPVLWNLEAGQDIPPDATVKLGENGKAYLDRPLSSVYVSTLKLGNVNALYQTKDLGSSGLIASVQDPLNTSSSTPYISFIGYNSSGVLSRLANAFKITHDASPSDNTSGPYSVAPIPNTEKCIVAYTANLRTYHKIVDYNGGTITQLAEVQVSARPGGTAFFIWIGEDASKNYYAQGSMNDDGNAVVQVSSVSKTEDVIIVEASAESDYLISSDNVSTTFLDNLVFMVGPYVYEFLGGVLYRRITATLGRASQAIARVSGTQVLAVGITPYNFTLDEGKTDESSFLVARTIQFSADYLSATVGDEYRFEFRRRQELEKQSDLFANLPGIVAYFSNDNKVNVINHNNNAIDIYPVSISLDFDFSNGSVSEFSRSAVMVDGTFRNPQLFNDRNNILYAGTSTAVQYQAVSVSASLPEKSTGTPIGINKTGVIIGKGSIEEFMSIVPGNKVFSGYTGLTIGKVISETAGEGQFAYVSQELVAYAATRRIRAASPETAIEDLPEFQPEGF